LLKPFLLKPIWRASQAAGRVAGRNVVGMFGIVTESGKFKLAN